MRSGSLLWTVRTGLTNLHPTGGRAIERGVQSERLPLPAMRCHPKLGRHIAIFANILVRRSQRWVAVTNWPHCSLGGLAVLISCLVLVILSDYWDIGKAQDALYSAERRTLRISFRND